MSLNFVAMAATYGSACREAVQEPAVLPELLCGGSTVHPLRVHGTGALEARCVYCHSPGALHMKERQGQIRASVHVS